MGFTEPIFIFVLLPLCLGGYFLCLFLERRFGAVKRCRVRDVFLCLFSLFFYSFFNLYYLGWILGFILLTYIGGRCIRRLRRRKAALIISVAAAVGILFFFKYYTYAVNSGAAVFGWSMRAADIIPPLGISFIVFSSISYFMDIYRGDAEAGGLLDTALYLSFFPKVISGPIVPWKDFASQMRCPRPDAERFVKGIDRVIIGFVKKVILADTFGAFVSEVTENLSIGIDVGSAWVLLLLFFLQIYLDFAGYSDIAIGLSDMMGFELMENFRFPYLSTSITDFWKRWHISLGNWFKEYLYIPLGGNRRSRARTLFNLLFIFLLTGVWHGAGLLYLLWGLMHGVCRVIEALIKDTRFYRAVPRFFKWLITTFIVMIGWTAFCFTSFEELTGFFRILFGISVPENPGLTVLYFVNMKAIVMLVLALLGTYLFALKPLQRSVVNLRSRPVIYAVSELALLAVFVLALIFMMNSTYSPFLYFRY